MFYPRGYREQMQWLLLNVTIRYVLLTKLQRENPMIIINVTFRYVLPTRLQRANAVIIVNVTIRNVLPTRLPRANAVIITRNTYLAITLAKFGLVTSLNSVSAVGRGYELDGWATANIVLKVYKLFFLFFFFFAYYVVLLLTVYWKADLALFRRPGFRKRQKQRTKFAWKLLFPGP